MLLWMLWILLGILCVWDIEVIGCCLTWASEGGAATSRVMVRRWSENPATGRNPWLVDSYLKCKYVQQKEMCHLIGSCKQNVAKDLTSIFAWTREDWQDMGRREVRMNYSIRLAIAICNGCWPVKGWSQSRSAPVMWGTNLNCRGYREKYSTTTLGH